MKEGGRRESRTHLRQLTAAATEPRMGTGAGYLVRSNWKNTTKMHMAVGQRELLRRKKNRRRVSDVASVAPAKYDK
ncbi:unnamed protein product [Caenorhabditis auriculariae]|uniref:Uncharacterized protein n=1 Tax=Caenorhabditis auriculariae TaxID=2777116 RepID=A0A8S1HT45_9PELO|nr:unnamed protein product [Caenorhabditis auriculariae]